MLSNRKVGDKIVAYDKVHTVTKVGRKYLYATSGNSSDLKVEISTGDIFSDYNSLQVFPSIADYNEYIESKYLISRIHLVFRYSHRADIDIDKLRAIAKILGIKVFIDGKTL